MQNKVQKAGAIILSNDDPRNVALLYRGNHGDWTFPKGHVDGGENATQAMLREIKEETGLTIKIIKDLANMEYENATEGPISLKMFLVESVDDTELKLEFETDDIQWIPYNEVVGKLSYDNLKEYFRLVLPEVKRVIESK